MSEAICGVGRVSPYPSAPKELNRFAALSREVDIPYHGFASLTRGYSNFLPSGDLLTDCNLFKELFLFSHSLISKELDELYRAVGTPERDAFRREAYAYYMGQIIHDNKSATDPFAQAQLTELQKRN